MNNFRVGIFWMNGSPLHIDIYDGPQYVAHCETPEQAQRIVQLLNQGELDKKRLDWLAKSGTQGRFPGRTFEGTWTVRDVFGWLISEGPTLREALDAAIAATEAKP